MTIRTFFFRPRAVATWVAIGAGLSAGACAQIPPSPADAPPAAASKAPVVRDDTPREGLSPDVFYRLMLGDIALQRGQTQLAARAYLEVARELKDARLARRSAEIAHATRQRATAEAAARLWLELEPQAERPRQILATLTDGPPAPREGAPHGLGDEELKLRLERLLADQALTGGGVGDAFLQLNRAFSQQGDKRAVYDLVRELAAPYTTSAEAQYAVALAAYNTGPADAAMAAAALERAELALKLRPDWERGALLKAEILAKRSPDDAVAWLRSFVAAQPRSAPARGALAQFYVEQKKLPEARAIFEALAAEDPETREYATGVAILSFQMKDWAAAEEQFGRLAAKGDDGSAQLYLAQIAEETRRYELAIERYRAVGDGERGWLSKLRVAALTGKLGRVDEARRYLADLPAVTPDQRIQVRQAEGGVLREAGRNAEAYAVLEQGLAEHPDSPDLLYDAGMIAEKIDRIDVAEARLKRLLELKPDDPQALNALGYTLVDRTTRHEEGRVLIEKALRFLPDDPFIQDSMGWALYKLGRHDEAERYLARAFAARPDAEIAAHLGEVLWAKGERVRAKELWAAQLKVSPDHPVLLETVRRLDR